MTNYYFKLEGIMNINEISEAQHTLHQITLGIHDGDTRVTVTHAETALMAHDQKMEYEIETSDA